MSAASSVILPTIIQSLLEISQSKVRCTAALQSIYEGRCVRPNQVDETVGNADANLIVISSFLIGLLLQSLSRRGEDKASRPNSNAQEESTNACAIVLAALSHSLSTVLLIDRNKFERIMNQHVASSDNAHETAKVTTDSRIILGRAFLNCVLGALATIDSLSRARADNLLDHTSGPFVRDALLSSLFCLEMVTKFNVKPSSVGSYNIQRNHISSSKSSTHSEKASAASSSTLAFHLLPLDCTMMNEWIDSLKSISSDIKFRSNLISLSTYSGDKEDNIVKTSDDISDSLSPLNKEVVANERMFSRGKSAASSTVRDQDIDAADLPLLHMCSLATTILFKGDSGSELLSLVLTILQQSGILNISIAPPRKRAKSSSSKVKSTEASIANSTLRKAAGIIFSSSSSSSLFDTKVALKRWASAALMWFCDGHEILLRAAISLLHEKSFVSWSQIMVARYESLDATEAVDSSDASVPNARKVLKNKRKASSEKQECKSRSKDIFKDEIFGNTTLVAYTVRLIDLVSDIGRVGEVSESVGLQLYLNSVWPFTRNLSYWSAPEPSKGRGRKKKKMNETDGHSVESTLGGRSDTREDIATLMRLLLVAHNRCIHDNVLVRFVAKLSRNDVVTRPSGHSTEYYLLTDEYVSVSRQRNNANKRYFEYCPFIDEVINNLALLSLHPEESEDERTRLMQLGTIMSLSYSQVFLEPSDSMEAGFRSVAVVDARLSSKSIELLGNTLDSIVGSYQTKEEPGKAAVTEEPKRIISASTLEIFKDLYSLHKHWPPIQPFERASNNTTSSNLKLINGEIISFFIRSFQTEGSSLGETAFRLLNAIFNILGACYSFDSSSKLIVKASSELATKCLRSIHTCLKSSDLVDIKTEIVYDSDIKLIGSLSRSFISTASLSSFIFLGVQLNKYLGPKPKDEIDTMTSDMKLWDYHVNLSRLFGQAMRSSSDVDVLEILKSVASVSSVSTFIVLDQTESSNISQWPLTLEKVHYPLMVSYLSSNLSVSTDSTFLDVQPEWIFCESVINSVQFILKSSIPAHENEQILFSRRDVDILILAVARLTPVEQSKLLCLFIGVISKTVASLSTDEQLRSVWLRHQHNSSFVARLIITIATLIDLVSTGVNERYNNRLGFIIDSCFPYPFRSSTNHHFNNKGTPSDWEEFGSFYRDDGVLDYLFDVSICLTENYNINFLPESEKALYRSALAGFLELGLEAAPLDGGYLMFSVWNACSRNDLWYSVWNGVTPLQEFSALGTGAKLMSLRKDLCFLYSEIRRNSENDDNYLCDSMRAINESSAVDPSMLVKDGTKRMIEVVNEVEQLVCSSMRSGPSAIECCIVEMISCIVSFLSSSFTTTEFQYLSSRDYCEDDSSGNGDSCIDSRINLHDTCKSCGMSPFFPDKLDITCHLRSGISRSDAVNTMNSLIQSLLLVGRWARRNFTMSLESLISKSIDINGVSLLPLVFKTYLSNKMCEVLPTYVEGDSIMNLLECVVNHLPTKSIEDDSRRKLVKSSALLWIRGLFDDFLDNDDLWAYSMGELRTNGEWEMIMAEALIGACSVVDYRDGNDDTIATALLYPLRWKRILVSIINALVPAIALLRFSLDDGNKRIAESDSYHEVKNWKQTILDILSFMADIVTSDEMETSMKRTAWSVANTLLVDVNDFSFIASTLSSSKLLHDINQFYFAHFDGDKRPAQLLYLFEILACHINKISGENLFLSLGYTHTSINLIGGGCTSVESIFPYFAQYSSAFGDAWRHKYLTPFFHMSLTTSGFSADSQFESISLIMRGLKVTSTKRTREGYLLEDLWYLWSQIDIIQSRLIVEAFLKPDKQMQSMQNDRELCLVLGTIFGSSISRKSDSLSSFFRRLYSDISAWTNNAGLEHLLYLCIIISLRFDTTEPIVNGLLLQYDNSTNQRLHYIELFFNFLNDLANHTMDSETKSLSLTSPSTLADWGIKQVASASILNGRCTFDQTGEDFTEQHWYNCYTCGLTWDRGCCSVCAHFCHQGHDTGYSRFSAFFCDCGATCSNSQKSPAHCRCTRKTLPVSLDVSATQDPSIGSSNALRKTVDHRTKNSMDEDFFLIASNIDPATLRKTLCSFVEEMVRAQLLPILLNRCCVLAENFMNSFNELKDFSTISSAYRNRNDDLSLRLRATSTESTIIDSIPSDPFIFRLLKAKNQSMKYVDGRSGAISKDGYRRRMLLAADSHARLYIAEQYKVSFVPAYALFRNTTMDCCDGSAIGRNIVGSSKVDFMVVGLSVAKENNRHVVVWGYDAAVVFIMNEQSTLVQAKVTLTCTKDIVHKSDNSLTIIQVDWVPGTSGNILALYFVRHIKVYDLRNSLECNVLNENYLSCAASVTYSITHELASVSLIPLDSKHPMCDDVYDKGGADGSNDFRYIFVFLCQSGYSNQINFSLRRHNFELSNRGEILIECHDGSLFSSPITTGDYLYSCFLPQSCIMLQHSSSSSVLALMYDQRARKFTDSFTLLTNSLEHDQNIRGPFFNWTELGVIQREDKWYYRVLCIGLCTSSNMEKLLYIEFNRYKTCVKAVDWPGMSETLRFEGTAVFSLPLLDSTNKVEDDKKTIREKVFFSAFRSDGSMLIFEDNLPSRNVFPERNSTKQSVHSFAVFESLICVTNSPDCRLECDASSKESDINAKKLSVGTRDMHYMPKKPYTTFTISLKSRTRAAVYCKEDYAIVAVRILVGSTSLESIPGTILLMGKEVPLSKSMRRYYDFVFNEEEIINVVRNGYITISVSTLADSPGTFVDAIEIYVLERNGIVFLQNVVKSDWVGWDFDHYISPALSAESIDNLTPIERIFSSIIDSSRLFRKFHGRVEQLPDALLSLIVRITFKRPCSRLASIIKEFPDEDGRIIMDEEILQNIIDFLGNYQAQSKEGETSDIFLMRELKFYRISLLANQCNKLALEIVSYRPSNYTRSIKRLYFNKKLDTSLSTLVKRVYDYCRGYKIEHIRPLIKLALQEAALMEQYNLPCISMVKTSALQVIGELILINSWESCPVIYHYVEETKRTIYESLTEAAYCCDICETFPIKIIRYTHAALSDVDICRFCYDTAYAYAESKNFTAEAPAVFKNGRMLYISGQTMSCSEISKLKSIPVSQVTINFDENNGKDEQTAGRKDNLKLLFQQVMESTTTIISENATCLRTTEVAPLFDLLLVMVTCYDCNERTILKKFLYEKVIQKMFLISPTKPNHQSVMIDCLNFLCRLIQLEDNFLERSNIETQRPRLTKAQEAADQLTVAALPVVANGSELLDEFTILRNQDVINDIRSLIITGSPALHAHLCAGFALIIACDHDEAIQSADESGSSSERKAVSKTVLNHLNAGVRDGVIETGALNSIALLSTRLVFDHTLNKATGHAEGKGTTDGNFAYVDSLLSLMCHLFENLGNDPFRVAVPQLECWLSPLCEIVVSRSEHMNKAKTVLKAICTMTNQSYSCAIDRSIYERSLTSIGKVSHDLFEAAIAIREKTLQYHNPKVLLSNRKDLHFASFAGSNDLISEDVLRREQYSKISGTLENLINTVRSSQANCWSEYCLSESTPHSIKCLDFKLNPLCFLFWLGCLFTGDNQVKVFKLIEIALTPINKETIQQGLTLSALKQSHDDVSFSISRLSLCADSIYSFIACFLFHGEKRTRVITANISVYLINALDDMNMKAIWLRLARLLSREIGPRGLESIEFLQFVQKIVGMTTKSRKFDLKILANIVMSAYLSQIQQFHPNICEIKRFHEIGIDLSQCSACMRSKSIANNALRTMNPKLNQSYGKTSPFNSPTDLSRFRIETITERTTFSDFAIHFQLKTRMEIHEISLSISEPRGRYVKTINVYFSPRPVNNATDLKMSHYRFWQLCGTLSLSRGSSSAKLKLEIPLIASNLKFEYKELQERNENNRKNDGNKSTQCPRCLSHISDTHGVCVVCGDAAFQCRRCRHINYDRLDAFFCVECGFCANGSFSYEVSGITASKAVAILDDDDMRRTLLQLKSCMQLAVTTRSSLTRKASTKHLGKGSDCSVSGLDMYDKPLSDCLLGKIPSFRHGCLEYNQGSRDSYYQELDISERVRSLLTQGRIYTTTHVSHQDSNVETLFRQALLSSRLLNDNVEASDDFLSEPHSRQRTNQDCTSDILARLLRRSDRESTNAIPAVAGESILSERKKSKGPNSNSFEETAEEVKKLFLLYRDTLRDCYEINRKLVAWTRLNRNGRMVAYYCDSNPAMKYAYIPSSCSHCSPLLSYHLLLLLEILFSSRAGETRDLINPGFIGSLLNFSDNHDDLNNLKRSLVVKLATESELCSETVILTALTSRLSTGDRVSAEILGQIISKSSSPAFAKLALDTIQSL